MSKPTLGYWKIRGLAAQIRYMFFYVGVDFEDVTYEIGEAPGFDKSCWFGVKPSMPHQYPNLPYLIDGDVNLTETAAIMKYIAHKWKPSLLGANSAEYAFAEMLSYHVGVLKSAVTGPSYSSPDGDREAILAKCYPLLEGILKFKGKNPWLVGESLTWLDFAFFELVEQLNHMASGKLLEKYPELAPYHQSFLELPGIAEAWKDDEKTMKYPFNNANASIGGRDSKW